MRIDLNSLEINYSYAEKRIIDFIKEYVDKSNVNGFVIGLSGGIDSTLTVHLLEKAVGSGKILALILPTYFTPKEDVEDAKNIAEKLGIKYTLINISEIFNSYRNTIPYFDEKDKISNGNLYARIRMNILYYTANKMNYLVAGTGDKSELLIGYFTKYGDGGCDILPIGDLYKTQVRKMAKYLRVPEKIVLKPSSPRLWPGQEAEKELNITYSEIDLILYCFFDKRMSVKDIVNATGISKEKVKLVLERVYKSAHKRRLPPIPRISGRTIGIDINFPLNYKIDLSSLNDKTD
ncbi:MAG TPA: NAD+ synthase [Thermoprotei archaeon]|nr:NAD+ synthase [Thermoprotei archaeon]